MVLCRGWSARYLFYTSLILIIPLLFSVFQFHQDQMSEEPNRKPSMKSNHLVLGPAAGQGLPSRLQCEGLRATNMDEPTRSRGNSKMSDDVSFVTVFTTYTSSLRSESSVGNDGLVTVGNTSLSKLERSMAILNTFIDFIQVSMPRSRVIILTDPASDFSVSRNSATVLPIKGDYSRGQLMLQRIRSYIAYLQTRLEQFEKLKSVNHYIFTDSDVAVVGDLGHMFQKYPHFHVAFTFRNNKDQPLNSGFIAVRGTRDGMLKAKSFLLEVLDAYISNYMKASRMLGDQLALASVVKSHLPFASKKFSRAEAFFGEINGASVLFLPCAVYNWTPPEGAGQFHGMPLDVQVIHFKGSRKRLMLEAWNFFNSTSSIPDMLCLILESGRTKYDF